MSILYQGTECDKQARSVTNRHGNEVPWLRVQTQGLLYQMPQTREAHVGGKERGNELNTGGSHSREEAGEPRGGPDVTKSWCRSQWSGPAGSLRVGLLR